MKIVLCYPVEKHHIQSIQAAAPDADVINAGQTGINEALPTADIFCGHAKVPVDWQRAVDSGQLKWIQSSAAGMDHCLTPPVIASGIVVTSASGLFANQVAEQTMALLFGLIRSLPTFFRAQQNREFIRRPTRDLHGLTIGIVGCGGNGRRIAEVLAPFQVRLIGTDLFPEEVRTLAGETFESLGHANELPTLLEQSDIVIVCAPLNEQTRGMIAKEQLALMKPTSFLINVGRGPLVVESDLVAALESKAIAGAGLDVTEIEPLPTTSPLWDLPNVIITPHVGAQSAVRVDTSTRFFCENLRRFRSGQPLQNVVDKRLGFPVPVAAATSQDQPAPKE